MTRRLDRLVAAAAAAVLVTGLVAAVQQQPDEIRTPVAGAPVAVLNARPELRATAVRALLDARSAALLTHDRAAFLATVDPLAPALRARQAAYVDALRAVPLASWTYEVDETREQPVEPALDRKYGTWWAPDVSLRYALEGFDRQPTVQAQAMVFVERAGRWYLGADDDVVASGRRAAHELWDGGPVVASRGTACLALGHPRQLALVKQAVADCDAAVPRVTRVWGQDWAQRVVVLVPSTVAELTRLVPEAGDLSRIAAVATAELLDPSTGYHPVGDRVLVNPVAFRRLSPLGRRVVVTHEVTHVASRAATGPRVPTWLVEGLADYVGYLGTSVPVAVAAEELTTDVRAGRLPTALPTDRAFGSARPQLAQAYEQSWLAVRLLVDRYGVEGVLRLYRAVGLDPDAGALDRALRAQLRLTTADLVRLSRADLQQRLG